ncbi:MAG TPA: enolase C-terminal domain-like protein [Xanthobacteraceae bacterium]|nr:enolase C-terminal domain-like protein [Xanthobacteraceae bacterium]
MDVRIDERTMPQLRHEPPLVIRRVEVMPVALPLKKPMAMAGVAITHAHNILVRVAAADGTVGWGEVAAAPTRTGDTIDGLVAAVRDHLAPVLVGKDANMLPALRRSMRTALFGNTGAHSAVEMALFDLAGRAAGKPLIELIGGSIRKQVAPMWLLGNPTPDADIAEAHAKEQEGFHFFKLKIGTKPIEKEIAATHALRTALGDRVPLCADANGGLTLADAQRYVRETRDAGLMFVEQPLPAEEFDALATLTKDSPVPIGADESFHSTVDLDTLARCGAGGVSLKATKLGGIMASVEAARRCRILKLSVNIAVLVAESSLSSAAAVHLACAVPDVSWGVSLTHFYLAEDIVRHPLPLGGGEVTLPTGPGLGVEVDEAAVARYRVG